MNPTFDICHCGGALEVVREREKMKMGSRSAIVEVERLACATCGERFATPDQMREAQRSLATQLRLQEGLLSPDQVRRIRVQYGLTQPEFERLLNVGPKTVVRWERGTVFQNRATDELLRIIEAVPSAYEHLATRRGLLAPAFGDEIGSKESHERHISYVARSKRRLPDPGVAAVAAFPKESNRSAVSAINKETTVPTIPEKQLT
jgi:HTH-type transcriptional regulator/antitoxin MqsA